MVLTLVALMTSACAKPGSEAVTRSNAESALVQGNSTISTFQMAKKKLKNLATLDEKTIYCPCKVVGRSVDLKSCGYQIHKDAKRAARLEWEHVVPAEAFGQSFVEWREGASKCVDKRGRKFKGRKCAERNFEFSRMEADLYNLWPIVGELNGMRSNYSMAEISGRALSFGGCRAKIANRKFEPMDADKGIVARVYLYMDRTYPGHGIVSEKNKPLFEAWNKLHPVSKYECDRADKVKLLQGNDNPVLSEACQVFSTKKNPLVQVEN